LRRLRTQWLPRDLRSILLSTNISVKLALERIQEYESFNIKQTSKDRSFTDKKNYKFNIEKKHNSKINWETKQNKLKTIKCFKCNDFGHYASSCNESTKKPDINNMKPRENTDGLDCRIVKINGKELSVVFDTGASNSIIGFEVVKNFKDVKMIDELKVFTLIDETEFVTHKSAILQVNYN
jgi:hypothetical protein